MYNEVYTKKHGIGFIEKKLYIPKYYKGNPYNFRKLIESKGDDSSQLGRYAKTLQKLCSVFSKGKMIKNSYFIRSPKGYAKTVFAYTVINLCRDANFRVGNLKDTFHVNREIKSGEDEYLFRDSLLIVRVQEIYTKYSFSVIEHVLNVRSQRGLPTIILSPYTISKLSNGEYDKYLYQKNKPKIRYPDIISLERG